MPWNSNSPDGTLSVRANRIPMNQNTTYIETTMGNSIVGTNTVSTRDHFWNVGSDEDGRHRFFQSVGFTQGTAPADPLIGAGMDGVIYLREVHGRVEGFYKNRPLELAGTPYQFIPTYLIGTHRVTGLYTNVVTIPDNCWGEIFFFQFPTAGRFTGQTGFFKSSGGVLDAWAHSVGPANTTERLILKFGNGADALGLDIRVRNEAEPLNPLDWHYRITYRAL